MTRVMQIPDIAGRRYPAALADSFTPKAALFPFFKPDLMVAVADPHRPGHELSYYPGEITLRMADVVVINKVDSVDYAGIETVRRNVAAANLRATVIEAASTLEMDDPDLMRGKRVLAA